MIALALVLCAAHPSLKNLVSSNGYGTLQYALSAKQLDRMLQHPYKYESQGTPTRDLLSGAGFGLAHAAGRGGPSEATLSSAAYVPGTGIIVTTQSIAGAQLTTYSFAPRTLAGTAFVMLARLDNAQALKSASLYAFVDQRLADDRPEPSSGGESIQYHLQKNGFEEYGPFARSAAVGVVHPLGGASRRTSGGAGSPTHPLTMLLSGAHYSDAIGDAASAAQYNADDIALGFEWELGDVPAGSSRWAGVAVSYDHGNVAADAWGRLDDWLSGIDDPAAVLAKETSDWSEIAALSLPEVMPEEEQALYRQSIVFLKMAQVQESGRSHGQILASPAASIASEWDQWNITWVRDMAYATVALAEAGQHTEARAALAFQLRAKVGRFTAPEFVGRAYQISACRYFGDGSEESDDNENGPNVEYDGFGLFLWSLGRYLELSGDKAFLEAYWPLIQERIADVLVALVEPYSGLIRADSSIWESHWNGKQRQYAYTSLTAVRGLCAAGKLAETMGEGDVARAYRNTARQIRQAIGARLVDKSSVLASSLEEHAAGVKYDDAAVLEAFAMKVLDPKGSVARATMDALFTRLAVSPDRGIYRNDEGDAYDNQEWVFVDLRGAIASLFSGRGDDVARAERLYAWVVAQSVQNANVIAELYDRQSADYRGSVPMAGFGAGAFVLAAHAKYALSAFDPACGSYEDTLETALAAGPSGAVTETALGGTEAKKAEGCDAALPGALPILIAGLALDLLLLRRRRLGSRLRAQRDEA